MNQSLQHQPAAGRIAFVQACWHRQIVDQARIACLDELQRLGVDAGRVDLYEVPGSLEIPLIAKRLAESGGYGAIIAAGFIVDGGIYRHEFVAGTVIEAMMRVQLDTGVPIISAVLTPQRFHESDEHRGFFHQHFLVKGREAAQACVATLANIQRLAALTAA
jgi:6,7-dimethyl-8-ribityllumazine synthase